MNKSVMKFIKTVKQGFGKRSPEILLGIGIASGITATVLAVKATPKALELLTEKRYEKYGDTLKEDDSYDDMPELKPVEVIKATWKCYIPAAISGVASIACLLGSHSVHAKRNAALATAYKLSETALNEYREKVVEEIGEDKEKVIRDKVSQKHLDEKPVSKNEVIITGTGKQLCYDGISGRYFESDIQTIRAAVNKINETMVYTGELIEIASGLENTENIYVTDPHPSLDYARYRIVAITDDTGAVSYYDPPGYPIKEVAAIIQWDETWSDLITSDVDEADIPEEPSWSGSLVRLPYNLDVSDKNGVDVSVVEYIGRKRPVSYYGTQLGETSSWKVEIPRYDTETLYALRRLAIYTGDVYVREPSGSGYWASISVSISQTHCEVSIPVSLDITRVEGGI